MIWMLCIFTLFLSSCEQKLQETHYREIVAQESVNAPSPAVQAALADQAGNMFSWDTPQGWEEMPGTGMRLASFHLMADAKAIDCSIVAIGGTAGGVEANLRRWMGQIGLEVTGDELLSLISSAPGVKIKTGQEGKIFDFTTIESKAKQTDKSMIAVMVPVGETTVFVKMTGAINALKLNKNNYLKLVSSIVRK